MNRIEVMERKTKNTQHYFRYKKRNRLIALIRLFIIIGIIQNSVLAQNVAPIKLSWLGGNPPALSAGVSWGVPLPEGKIDPSTNFSLKNDLGTNYAGTIMAIGLLARWFIKMGWFKHRGRYKFRNDF